MVTLAKVDPNNDIEESKRRSELTRSVSCLGPFDHPGLTLHSTLEHIGKQSLALSEKGKIARALDKTRDSGKVADLVEELRQAVLIYQVSASRYRSRTLLMWGKVFTTAVDIQSGRSFDRKFLLVISDLETHWMVGQSKASFDVLLKLNQVS